MFALTGGVNVLKVLFVQNAATPREFDEFTQLLDREGDLQRTTPSDETHTLHATFAESLERLFGNVRRLRIEKRVGIKWKMT